MSDAGNYIAWPDSIPLPFIDASAEPRNVVIASPPDTSGFIQRRLRFKNYPTGMSISWSGLEPEQYKAFKAFYLNTLNNGASLFLIDLRYPKSSELTQWAVRFIDRYSADYQDGLWMVSATIDLIHQIGTLTPAVGAAQGFLVQPDLAQFDTVDNEDFYVLEFD